MKAADLIKRLSEVPPDTDVMVLDGFNGGGLPREINVFSDHVVSEAEADECCDCEGLVGQSVCLLGYGSY